MSAHHYFRDFMACDSGMIPWLLMMELICRRGESLKDILAERRAAYPSSGEVNFRVEDQKAVVDRIEAEYAPKAEDRDETDGLSLNFGDWRFNLRASNTEPLLRLNIEARGDAKLVREKLAEMRKLIEAA
jgi:phosphomannomutase